MEVSDEVWEIAQDLYNEADIDVNRYGQVDGASFMDFDEYNGYYRDCTKADFDKAIEYLNNLLTDEVKFYTDYNRYLELSDNHTLWNIDIPSGAEFNDEDYSFMYTEALEHLQDEIGVDVFGLGRSGRHICVEDNFRNLTQLDKFKEAQSKWEDWLIKTIEDSFKDGVVDEAKELAPDEKIAKCLSCGMKVRYKNKDVQHDAMGDYIECPNCKSTFDVDYDNTPTKKTEGDIKYYNKEILLNEFKAWCDKKLYNVAEVTENEIDEFLASKWIEIEQDIQDENAVRHMIDNLKNMLKRALASGKKVEDLSPAEEIDLADDINTYLMENLLYPVDVFAADTRVMVEIEWGDWKHDHLRCDALMELKGYTLVEEEVTEEDGSDCYSAIRHYEPKGKFDNVDIQESKKTEAKDYSAFTPTNKVLSGNKGLSEKAINEMRWSLPEYYKDMTDEQKQINEELSLRGMVMSCLIYGQDIHTSTNNVSVDKYRGRPYVDKYYDTLGKDVTEEIIKQQTEYFKKGKVIHNTRN